MRHAATCGSCACLRVRTPSAALGTPGQNLPRCHKPYRRPATAAADATKAVDTDTRAAYLTQRPQALSLVAQLKLKQACGAWRSLTRDTLKRAQQRYVARDIKTVPGFRGLSVTEGSKLCSFMTEAGRAYLRHAEL